MIQHKHSFHMNTFHTTDISFKEFNCSSWTSSTKKGDTAVDESCTNKHAQRKITHLSSCQYLHHYQYHYIYTLYFHLIYHFICSLFVKPDPKVSW